MTAPLRKPDSMMGVLTRLMAHGQLHQADAIAIGDGIARQTDPTAVYLALERLTATVDHVPGRDWWALIRRLAPTITTEQVARVRHAGADLELLRSHGLGALRHFDPAVRPTAAGWRAAVQDRQDQIAAVAREVTAL